MTGGAWAEGAGPESFRPEEGYAENAGGDGRLAAQALQGPPGWKSGWSLPKSGRSPLFLYRDAAALTFPAIRYPAGGGAQAAPAGDETIRIGRQLDKSIPAKGNTAIYVSFLLKVSQHTPRGKAHVFFNGIGAGLSDGSLMAYSRQNAVNEQGKKLPAWVPILYQPYQANTVYYFVLKASDGGDNWGGGDDLEVWINPRDVSTEAAATDALFHNTESPGNILAPSGGVSSAVLEVENFSGATVTFDELRAGTTWESVAGAAPK